MKKIALVLAVIMIVSVIAACLAEGKHNHTYRTVSTLIAEDEMTHNVLVCHNGYGNHPHIRKYRVYLVKDVCKCGETRDVHYETVYGPSRCTLD